MATKKNVSINNFEESLKKLETIIQKMEEGECSLDEAFSIFEEGVCISKKCSKLLEDYERKIMIVKEKKIDGSSSSKRASSEQLDFF